MAKIALLYSSVFGDEAYESLLSFMKSDRNDPLDEVRGDFEEICGKLVPPIELFCAWEQNPTSVSYTERFAQIAPGLLNQTFFKKLMETSLSAALGSGTVSERRERNKQTHLTMSSISLRKSPLHCQTLTASA